MACGRALTAQRGRPGGAAAAAAGENVATAAARAQVDSTAATAQPAVANAPADSAATGADAAENRLIWADKRMLKQLFDGNSLAAFGARRQRMRLTDDEGSGQP